MQLLLFYLRLHNELPSFCVYTTLTA